MMNLSFQRLALLLALILAMTCNAQAAPPKYKVLDIGTLGGAYSWGLAINDSGQVTGASYTSANQGIHAFLYTNGSISDLGTGGMGGTYSSGNAINDSGLVAGIATSAQPVNHAALYGNGNMALVGPWYSDAYGINNSEQVVGGFTTVSGQYHAFLYGNGSMTDLNTLGGTYSVGFGINDSGQVTGYSLTSGIAEEHAFLYGPGGMTDLGTLGGTSSEGLAINASGQVVGASDTLENGAKHAFLASVNNGQVSRLDLNTLGGTSSLALGINDFGQVTGNSTIAGDAEVHAFLYDSGTMYDLNSLLDDAYKQYLFTEARDINNKGWIIGTGLTPTGQPHALLAYLEAPNPTAATPEPASVLLMGVGAAGVAWMRRRKLKGDV